jgi:phage FluMu protein Com
MDYKELARGKCKECSNVIIGASKFLTLQREFCPRPKRCKDIYWKKKNPTALRDWMRKRRREIISHYGGMCSCCGESIYEFLCIDHINGGGTKLRKLKGYDVSNFIKKNNYPKEFRVLCHNCNSALGFYGYCPHERL